MALQSSGAISLSNIQTEFGGTNPIGLSEYYSKGNAPASGEIQLAADFYGTSNTVSLDFVRRSQYTPTSSTTISNVAIGAANPNRMVILQSAIQNLSSANSSNQITACTIGGITATIFGLPQVVYAKVPTGTTADIVLTYSSSAGTRLQVNTINTVNSAPTFQATATTGSTTPSTQTFTQNPVDPEGVFMWGWYHNGFGNNATSYTLATTSAGGVDVVSGYNVVDPANQGSLARASMAISETSNSDSRNVSITQGGSTPKGGGYYMAVYFQAN